MTLIDPFLSSPLIEAILQNDPEVCSQPLSIPDDGLEDVPLFAMDDILLLSESNNGDVGGTLPTLPLEVVLLQGRTSPPKHEVAPLKEIVSQLNVPTPPTPKFEVAPLESADVYRGKIRKKKRQKFTKRKVWAKEPPFLPCFGRINSDGSNSNSENCGIQVRRINSDRSNNSSESCEIQVRRCKSCNTDETPQWRVGPDGPRTLCNACGIRFKSKKNG